MLYAHVVSDHHSWYGIRSWIARLRLVDGSLERVFIDRYRDYRGARGVKLKGLMNTYFLEIGACYEEQRRRRRCEAERVFFLVELAGPRLMTRDEVLECLQRM
jgi:hypothetical protein